MEITFIIFPILLFVAFAGACWKACEVFATSMTYNVPVKRLFNPRWAITDTGLTYVFCGRKWYDLRPTPMEAVFWLGNTNEQKDEVARRIVQWANEHELDGLPDLSDFIDVNARENGSRRYASPDEIMGWLEEWRNGERTAGRVREV